MSAIPIQSPCSTGCKGSCRQGHDACEFEPKPRDFFASCPPEAASSCSEFLTPDDSPRRRLGPLTGIERAILRRRPTYTWAAVVALAIVAAVVRGLP